MPAIGSSVIWGSKSVPLQSVDGRACSSPAIWRRGHAYHYSNSFFLDGAVIIITVVKNFSGLGYTCSYELCTSPADDKCRLWDFSLARPYRQGDVTTMYTVLPFATAVKMWSCKGSTGYFYDGQGVNMVNTPPKYQESRLISRIVGAAPLNCLIPRPSFT